MTFCFLIAGGKTPDVNDRTFAKLMMSSALDREKVHVLIIPPFHVCSKVHLQVIQPIFWGARGWGCLIYLHIGVTVASLAGFEGFQSTYNLILLNFRGFSLHTILFCWMWGISVYIKSYSVEFEGFQSTYSTVLCCLITLIMDYWALNGCHFTDFVSLYNGTFYKLCIS